MKRVMAAIDHSAASLRAADLAIDVAARYGAELTLLTVVHSVSRGDAGMEAYARSEHLREPVGELLLAAERDALEAVRAKARAGGVAAVSVDVAVGDPAGRILELARARAAELIVLGTRGHGQLAGLLIGSVALKVVSLAGCPVLVVH